MKKIVSWILVFIMCLSLCGCGKSEAVKNVEAMIDALGEITLESENKIEEAEQAFYALSPEDQEKVDNLDILLKARERVTILFYVDEWVPVSTYYNPTLTLKDDLTCDWAMSDWELTDNGIIFPVFGNYGNVMFERRTIDGVDHLVTTSYESTGLTEDYVWNYVRAEDASISEYEITLDNWDEYFDLETVLIPIENAFGEIERYDYLLTLALKAEYGDRVVPTEDLNNKITVEFSFQPIDQLVEISEDLQITTFGETVYQGRSDKIISEVPLSALFDVNIDSEFKAEHQMNISAYAIGLFNTQATYSEDYDALILTTLNDLSVTRITGMLPLYDKPVHKH